ncbi:tetratricopeptide repeat protein [bacterium]|nr:tetratricopeptide repeat protein [bacterium]
MIGKSEELQKYLIHCSRVPVRDFIFSPSPCIVVSLRGFLVLNIVMAIGLFLSVFEYVLLTFLVGFIIQAVVFGGVYCGAILQVIAFIFCFHLAKTKLGLGLVISAFVIFFIVVLTPLRELPFLPFLPFVLSYIGSWAYANVVFSRYRKLAKQRIADSEKESSPTTNDILEKGVLLLMLARKPQALAALKSVLEMEGGDAFLWNLGGLALSNMKMYPEALTALDKATKASPDDRLLKKIKRNRKLPQKKFGRLLSRLASSR